METKDCLNCDRTGWVCEGHPDRPWAGISKRQDACSCGPGVPCPICIPKGEMPAPRFDVIHATAWIPDDTVH